MFEWSYLLKIAIALFAIVNPIGTVPIFITATAGWSKFERKKRLKQLRLPYLLSYLCLPSSATNYSISLVFQSHPSRLVVVF